MGDWELMCSLKSLIQAREKIHLNFLKELRMHLKLIFLYMMALSLSNSVWCCVGRSSICAEIPLHCRAGRSQQVPLQLHTYYMRHLAQMHQDLNQLYRPLPLTTRVHRIASRQLYNVQMWILCKSVL
jgi:hypothetical protein